jgi:deoxyribodipyrimidine photo-lyase|tara:strand:- start:333 stop:1622 length:1290 start_codon:yes stop_codon:yes gene_type:complete
MVIFWFRRDLRLDDNHALFKALKSGYDVLPIFIFDSNITNKLNQNDHRLNYINNVLDGLNKRLSENKKKIYIYKGNPIEIISKLIIKLKIKEIYLNKDYEPYARDRDDKIEKLCVANNVSYNSFKDHVIFEEDQIVKKDGTPYVVYTPYSRKWIEKFQSNQLDSYPSELNLGGFVDSDKIREVNYLMDFEKNIISPKTYNLNKDLIDKYEETRNFPALDSTSRIGVNLRFGTVSTRKIVKTSSERSNNTFLKELIWREFFIQILWHFPHTTEKSFKDKYERIEWRNDMDDFKLWCDGKTGYPIVDAGMNQLNKTGFMHNRLRMVVGSFLCKHLLIDWRLGEKYFADKLFDYEQASNVGNWQWVAGCGVDAAPYFRIFNPEEQQKKFDKELQFIKKWIPNYDKDNYINKIVDHKFARERCLNTYKKALNK